MIYFFAGLVFLIGLFWGSFLNVVAYRLAHQKSLLTARSRCPYCNTIISWYDNIPLLSYVVLRGRCRLCKEPISFLYPVVEFITGIIFLVTLLFFINQERGFVPMLAHIYESLDVQGAGNFVYLYTIIKNHLVAGFFVHLLFFSALIIALRTDLEAMVIPQCVSLWLVPAGIFFSWCGFTGVSWQESILGAILGYGVLWGVAFIFRGLTHKDGMGVGDMELLAMIGSFLGVVGAWLSLMVASLFGVIIGLAYLLLMHKKRSTHIPFGPFLVFGAIIYFFFKDMVLAFLYC